MFFFLQHLFVSFLLLCSFYMKAYLIINLFLTLMEIWWGPTCGWPAGSSRPSPPVSLSQCSTAVLLRCVMNRARRILEDFYVNQSTDFYLPYLTSYTTQRRVRPTTRAVITLKMALCHLNPVVSVSCVREHPLHLHSHVRRSYFAVKGDYQV